MDRLEGAAGKDMVQEAIGELDNAYILTFTDELLDILASTSIPPLYPGLWWCDGTQDQPHP